MGNGMEKNLQTSVCKGQNRRVHPAETHPDPHATQAKRSLHPAAAANINPPGTREGHVAGAMGASRCSRNRGRSNEMKSLYVLKGSKPSYSPTQVIIT